LNFFLPSLILLCLLFKLKFLFVSEERKKKKQRKKKVETAMKFVLAVVLAALVAASVLAAPPKWHQLTGYTFERYMADFKKSYASPSEKHRRERLFYTKLAAVQAHNADKTQTYKKGVNHMSDWTAEEFQRLNGGRIGQMQGFENKALQVPYTPSGTVPPKSVDLRNRLPPILTAVKDQGQCGSCWAHGSTETMESYWAIATGNLFVLSQQQVTACAPNPKDCGGFGGCQGSTAELAFEYVVGAGLTQEWEYPYTAYYGTTGNCSATAPAVIQLSGYTKLPTNDQGAVMDALATKGPLAVNVDASSWSDYESGVFSGCNYANNISIDHVVQLVGYGTDADLNVDYWIVRNSWSPAYGEHGYIRVLKTDTAQCGWDVNPQDGTGCSGGPPQLWTCGMCGIVFDTSYPIVVSN
jgi:cathepsin L